MIRNRSYIISTLRSSALNISTVDAYDFFKDSLFFRKPLFLKYFRLRFFKYITAITHSWYSNTIVFLKTIRFFFINKWDGVLLPINYNTLRGFCDSNTFFFFLTRLYGISFFLVQISAVNYIYIFSIQKSVFLTKIFALLETLPTRDNFKFFKNVFEYIWTLTLLPNLQDLNIFYFVASKFHSSSKISYSCLKLLVYNQSSSPSNYISAAFSGCWRDLLTTSLIRLTLHWMFNLRFLLQTLILFYVYTFLYLKKFSYRKSRSIINFNFLKCSHRSNINLVYCHVFKKLYTFRKGFFGKTTSSHILLRRRAPRNSLRAYVFSVNKTLNIMQSSLMISVSLVSWKGVFYTFFKNAAETYTIFRYFNASIFSYSFDDYLNYFSLTNSVFASFKYLGNLSINSDVIFLSSIFDSGIRYARSMHSYAKIISYNSILGIYSIKLPSGFFKIFFTLTRALMVPSQNAIATNEFLNLKKAGFSSRNGFRPKVRGVAMNPVDHPHGGRTKSIKLPKTPWGLITKRK